MSDGTFSEEHGTLESVDPLSAKRNKELSGFVALSGEEEKYFSDYAARQIDLSDPMFPALNGLRESVARYYEEKKRNSGRPITRNETRLLELWLKSAIAIRPYLTSQKPSEFAWLADPKEVEKARKKGAAHGSD